MEPQWNGLGSLRSLLFRWRHVSWKRRSSSTDDEHMQLVDRDRDGDHLHEWNRTNDQDLQHQQQCRQRLLRILFGIALAVLVVVLVYQLPLKPFFLATSAWIKQHTFLGTFVAIALFMLAIPLCVPSTIVETLAGSLFGVVHGTMVTVVGKTCGSLLTFWIGRKVGNAMIGDYLATNFPTFRALTKVFNRASWKPLILFQLSSIPNLIKCYGLAITNVSSMRFALSAMVGNVPHAVIWANIGSQASDIAAILYGKSELSQDKLLLLVGGAVLTVLAMAFLVVYTKRELQELQKLECPSGSEDEPTPISISIAIDTERGLAMHSDENELIKVRSASSVMVTV